MGSWTLFAILCVWFGLKFRFQLAAVRKHGVWVNTTQISRQGAIPVSDQGTMCKSLDA